MKRLQGTKQWGRAITALALAATTAQAVNHAISTQQVETVIALVSNPLPTLPAPSTLGYMQVTGQIECDEGSIVLRLGGEPETPGLTLVFHAGEAQLGADGEMPGELSGVQGNGAFDFRLSILKLTQPVRTCRLETRKQGAAAFETVAHMAWPTPLLPSQEPVAWLATGVATAGLAGDCRIGHFAIRYVVPPSLFMVK